MPPKEKLQRHNQDGSFLVEGTLTLLAFSGIFVAFVHLGLLALEAQHLSHRTERAAWYAVTGTPEEEMHPDITIVQEYFKVRAESGGDTSSPRRSMSLTAGGMSR